MAMGWDDIVVEPEDVTEEEAKEIETGNESVPPGIFMCTVVDSKPKQIDYKKYSTLGCTLVFQVDKVLELEGEAVTAEKAEAIEGRKIYDDVAFAPAGVVEPDWAKNRRKMIALRLGLIVPGEKLYKSAWQEDVIGKPAKIKVLPGDEYQAKGENGQKLFDDDGKPVMKMGRPKIGFFDGYLKLDSPAEQIEEWSDI